LGKFSTAIKTFVANPLLMTWVLTDKELEDIKDEGIIKKMPNVAIKQLAHGVNVQVRLGEDKKICLLEIIGVTENGDKELLAVHPGYRESKESWLTPMRSLVGRGLSAPLLAVGDGALGFWAALRTCGGFEKTQEQRCWVHKFANVLDKLPKRL
jgi:hypothetical protein